MRVFLIGLAIVLVLILCILIFYIPYLKSPTYTIVTHLPLESKGYAKLVKPEDPNSPVQIGIIIDEGITLNTLANRLEAVHLVSPTWFFTSYIKWRNDFTNVKHGLHYFHTGMNVDQIIDELKTSRGGLEQNQVEEIQVTIREGQDIFQIARSFDLEGIAKEEAVLAAGINSDLAKKYQLPLNSVEGFLFPETLRVFKNSSAQEILDRYIQEFFQRYSKSFLAEEAKRLKLANWYDVITLASMVEKEVALHHERQLVADLYWSRFIHHNMNLECDPTALYAVKRKEYELRDVDLTPLEDCRKTWSRDKRLDCDCANRLFPNWSTNAAIIYNWRLAKYDYDGVLGQILICRKEDGWHIDWTKVNEPHNTYVDRPYEERFPPSPISNPGDACIQAVLNASYTEYKFFVADGKGESNFATSRADHSKNVEAYKKSTSN